MAIIDGVPGLEATIQIEGVTAREYDAPDDELPSRPPDQAYFEVDLSRSRASAETRRREGENYRPHVVKYIEAKPGASFSFVFKRSARFNKPKTASGIWCGISVDGILCQSAESDMHRPSSEPWEVKRSKISSYGDGGKMWRGLYFRDLVTDDRGNYTSKELKAKLETAQHLGVLKLEFHYQAGFKPTSDHRSSRSHEEQHSQLRSVPEKALKGRSLNLVTGLQPLSPARRATQKVCNVDPMNRPFAVFEFRYRSMEGLMQECIVPRPRSVTPLALPRSTDRNSGSDEKKKDRATSTAVKRELKRERSTFDDDELEMIVPKRERKYKTRRLRDGRLEIDLTGDD